MQKHQFYINRCLQIARNSLGTTRPNPMVGAVLVCDNKIIGEGFTNAYGGSHAEVNAINSVTNKSLLPKSKLYVTLEPCSHFGKTPPCSDLIITHKIPEVIIGCIDDNPEVAGKGIAKLKAAGCNVIVGVLEAECKAQLKRFFTYHNKKRPYIILKWAETKDGFIAPTTKEEQKPVWITNTKSRQLTHKWRAQEQAILVGTNTVLEDNPSLTVRDWTGENPIRVVLDKDLKLPETSTIFNSNSETLVICKEPDNFPKPKNVAEGWTIYPPIYGLPNAIYRAINWSSKKTIAQQVCNVLYDKQINSIIIEGGLKTLQTFIDEGLWNEARVFTGDIEFKTGTKSPKLKGELISELNIENDVLKIYAKN